MQKVIIVLLFILVLISCKNSQTMSSKNDTNTYAFRLKPGQDLKLELEKIVKEKNIAAGWVATCVGSLTNYNIRFANQPNGATGIGHFEIVSLVGTLSTNGSHIHISVSDSSGATIGGHLLQGCTVYTTAEVVIQSSSSFIFKREKDGSTAWEELQVVE